jgi:hypothetical protein
VTISECKVEEKLYRMVCACKMEARLYTMAATHAMFEDLERRGEGKPL